MKSFKQTILVVVTLAITFVIPITVTQVVRDNPEDVRTRAQEITSQAANTVNSGFSELSGNSEEVSLPGVGSVSIFTIVLFGGATIFAIIAGLATYNVVKERREEFS